MAGKSVVVDGGVTATAGTTMFTGADSGAWTAGAVTYQSYPNLTINGVPAIYQASCTFTFSGLSSSSAPVTGAETVTLTASATLMQGGLSNVLVDGDQATGTYGNQLTAQSSGLLKTA